MDLKLLDYIKADLFRYAGKITIASFIDKYCNSPGFKFTCWLRICNFQRKRKITKYTIFPFSRFIYRHYKYKYGFDIPYDTQIGKGLLIFHISCIVINGRAKIGENFTISHGVTIGEIKTGKNKGVPIIGNNVYCAPGSKVVGGIILEDNITIAANSVVTKSFTSDSIIAGIPGIKISDKGAKDYVINPYYS